MSKVDDELSRRLREAQRPVDADELFEGLARRRSRHERARRARTAALGFAVLASTIAGFLVLRSAFQPEDRGPAVSPDGLAANGEIVYSAEGSDGYMHLYAVQPDGTGRRQITDFGTNDTDPAVSPDGRTIAFVHQLEDAPPAIGTIPIDGGVVNWLTDAGMAATDPSWSPDGSRIAFVVDRTSLYTAPSNGSDARPLVADIGSEIEDPSWSPDGSRIVFAVRAAQQSGLATVRPDGRDLRPLETGGEAYAPAWSPDGSLIAFLRPDPRGVGIWTVPATRMDPSRVAAGVVVEGDLAWAPDATSLLVSDGDWIYRVDATSEGDPRDNFTQLVRGTSPSWQPIPSGIQPSPTASPEPEPSPSAGGDVRDVGLGLGLCHVEQMDGIDWYGDGTTGTAWTGALELTTGGCPDPGAGDYVVAADLDGDGVAEPGGMGFLANCLLCRPYAATDLNGDGVLELVVLEEASSTPSYTILEVSVPTSERSPGVYNLFVAPPGAPEANVPAGEPLRIDAGGDEGYSSEIVCDPPVIAWTWTLSPVDADGPTEVHYVEIQLGNDGAFHVVGRNDFTVPSGEAEGVTEHTAPTCGVDWHPAA